MITESMFARSANPVSHRLARIAFILACVGGGVVASAGPLHRYAGLDFEPVLALFRYGFYVALAGVALGVATILPTRPGDRRRGFLAALLAVVIGGAAIYTPLAFLVRAQQSPMLNDVSTDTANPPPLVATLPLRRGATNPAAWAGGNAPVLQRDAYPDIGPAVLAVPPTEAFRRAEAIAAAMGWTVVASRWFGFRDDIVVRVRPDGGGSRVDIRSKSRNGESDLGVNAERIREFVARLKSGN